MGQRSQIYVRFDKGNGKKGLLAKYYGWNYGERMVSRARHGMEYIHVSMIQRGYYDRFQDNEYKEKVSRIFDTNFDMQDVAMTGNIVDEWNRLYPMDDFNCVFNAQDNNNGKLFVDVSSNGIKYCFTDSRITKPLTAEEYMVQDYDVDNWQEYFRKSEYHTEEEITTCLANMEIINEVATLMTEEELQEFVEYDYVADMDDLPVCRLMNTDIATSFTTATISINDVLNGRYVLDNNKKWLNDKGTEQAVYKLLMGLPICITSYIYGDKHVVQNPNEIANIEYWIKSDGGNVTINGKEYVFSKLSEAEQKYLLNKKCIVTTVIGSVNDATEEQKENLIKVVDNYY